MFCDDFGWVLVGVWGRVLGEVRKVRGWFWEGSGKVLGWFREGSEVVLGGFWEGSGRGLGGF